MGQHEKAGRLFPCPEKVYVCLNCGRRSRDRSGLHTLTPGWSTSCMQASVQFQARDLQLNDRGFVEAIRKNAVLTYAARSLN